MHRRDRRQHVGRLFVAQTLDLLLDGRQFILAAGVPTPCGDLGPNREHRGRFRDVRRHPRQHRRRLVAAGRSEHERDQGGPGLRSALGGRRFEQFAGRIDLALANEHIGPEQRDLRGGDVGRFLEHVEQAVDTAPIPLLHGPLRLLLHPELQKGIPDLRHAGEPLGRKRRRDRLELHQRLFGLAGRGERRRRARAGSQRRRILAEHAAVDVELRVKLVELCVALPQVEVHLPDELR